MKKITNNKPQWITDFENGKFGKSIPENKETFFGSWADFEAKTGMTKKQYYEREKNTIID